MTTFEDLVRDLRGVVPGFDDPAVALELSDGRGPEEVLADVLMDLAPESRAAAIATIEQDRPLVLVLSVDHPSLVAIVEWSLERNDVVVCAGASGPRVPAVIAMTPPPVSSS